jgi:hypothetical protein
MPISYKPAQVQGTASLTTYSTLYSTPTATEAVVSTIAICNTSSSTQTYRIAIMSTAGTPAAVNWVVYDSVVNGNDTISLTLGICLDASKFVRVSSSANTVTFSAYVSEIT